ncbi:ATP synthase subunit gamma, mitochondrial-like [Nilaparvata lugens]|uniref:ATP synthase subunit gamma, mitochondrial-like n=1 Tax=Nilaparvata lugens TaxID=108931 RepID=UPI00193E1742|nr:ATP synthase subunit gamma, mitochondrial-like [Nilaparvata lugens]
MVSAAKYARAEKLLSDVKDFGLGTKVFYNLFPVEKEAKDGGGVAAFAVTSDRGLCGACHNVVSKRVVKYLEGVPENPQVVCVGEKSRSILRYRFKDNILLTVGQVGQKPPTFLDASRIVIEANELGLGEMSWFIAYNKFESIVKYETSEMEIASVKSITDSEEMYKYEVEEPEDLLDYLEFSRPALLFYAMCESSCSEQSSRMTAMDNASKNASEMIGRLQLQYNRNRQRLITTELIEIISGASALEKEE